MFPAFNALVCSTPTVRNALDIHPVFRLWWKAVLALHGKPSVDKDAPEQTLSVAANGFRFYAQLYGALGLAFLALAPFLLFAGDALPLASARYWSLTSALAGLFLCAISSLGFHGASAMRRARTESLCPLVAFMVAIIGFLSGLVAVLSLVVANTSSVNEFALLAGGTLLSVFGAGSYLIEIFYLMTDGRVLLELAGEGQALSEHNPPHA